MTTISHVAAGVVQTNSAGQATLTFEDTGVNVDPYFVLATVQDPPAQGVVMAVAVVIASTQTSATVQVFEFKSVNLLGIQISLIPAPAPAGRNVYVLVHRSEE